MDRVKLRIRKPSGDDRPWSVVVEGRVSGLMYRVYGKGRTPAEAAYDGAERFAAQSGSDMADLLAALDEEMAKEGTGNGKGQREIKHGERGRIAEGIRTRYEMGGERVKLPHSKR